MATATLGRGEGGMGCILLAGSMGVNDESTEYINSKQPYMNTGGSLGGYTHQISNDLQYNNHRYIIRRRQIDPGLGHRNPLASNTDLGPAY
jgi:hypothetical protein